MYIIKYGLSLWKVLKISKNKIIINKNLNKNRCLDQILWQMGEDQRMQ